MGRMGRETRGGWPWGALGLAALALTGIVACGGEGQPTEPAGGSVASEAQTADVVLGTTINELTLDLGLTDEQRVAIRDMAIRGNDRAGMPGAAWYAAAELQAILDSDQVAELGRRWAVSRGQSRIKDRERVTSEPRLTRAQRDQLRDRRNGLETRREDAQMKRGVARERRKAEHSAMVGALGLTDTQMDAMNSLREDHGFHQGALEEILTEEQQEVVTLHRAMMSHHFRANGSDQRGHGTGRRGRSMGGLGGPRVPAPPNP